LPSDPLLGATPPAPYPLITAYLIIVLKNMKLFAET
jgi:hypothetical protein